MLLSDLISLLSFLTIFCSVVPYFLSDLFALQDQANLRPSDAGLYSPLYALVTTFGCFRFQKKIQTLDCTFANDLLFMFESRCY